MQTKKLLAVLLAIAAMTVAATGHTTEFTYQGKLNDGGLPVTTSRDLRFRLWDAAAAGSQLGEDVTAANVAFTNGVFTVQLDFGLPVFNGEERWLEIAVSDPGANNYTTLSP